MTRRKEIYIQIALATALVVVFFCISLLPYEAKAYEYPSDTKTYMYDAYSSTGGTDYVVLMSTSTRTILFAGLESSGGSSELMIYCGNPPVNSVNSSSGNDIVDTHAQPAALAYPMAYHCDKPITARFVNVSNFGAHVFLNYVERDTRTTIDPLFSTSTLAIVASSTTPTVGGFTYGDIMIILLLILIVVFCIIIGTILLF